MKDEGDIRKRRIGWGGKAAVIIGIAVLVKGYASIMGFASFEDPAVSHNPETYEMVVRVTFRELAIFPPIAFGLLYVVRTVLDRTASSSIKAPD